MDYLEGALLGKLWSDTDYENRSHRVLTLSLCGLFWLYGFYLIYRLNFVDVPRTLTFFFLWFIGAVVLTLLSPLLNYVYYNLSLPLRWLVLGAQTLKFLFSFLFLYALFVPLIRFDKDKLVVDLMSQLNNSVGSAFEKGLVNLSVANLVVQAILMALLAILVLTLFYLILVILPYLYMKLLRLIQYTVDQIFIRGMRSFKREGKVNWQRLVSTMRDEAKQKKQQKKARQQAKRRMG